MYIIIKFTESSKRIHLNKPERTENYIQYPIKLCICLENDIPPTNEHNAKDMVFIKETSMGLRSPGMCCHYQNMKSIFH